MSGKLYALYKPFFSERWVHFYFGGFPHVYNNCYYFWVCTLYRIQSLSQQLFLAKKKCFILDFLFSLKIKNKTKTNERNRLLSFVFSRIVQCSKICCNCKKWRRKKIIILINERINDTMLTAYLQFENDE